MIRPSTSKQKNLGHQRDSNSDRSLEGQDGDQWVDTTVKNSCAFKEKWNVFSRNRMKVHSDCIFEPKFPTY